MPNITGTVTVDNMNATDEIKAIARKVLSETDIAVFLSGQYDRTKNTFVYLEKDGNVGNIEYSTHVPFGYAGHFHITPSRDFGSSIGVWPEGSDDEGRTYDLDIALEMCKGAVESTKKWPFNDVNKTFDNEGWGSRHSRELVQVVL